MIILTRSEIDNAECEIDNIRSTSKASLGTICHRGVLLKRLAIEMNECNLQMYTFYKGRL